MSDAFPTESLELRSRVADDAKVSVAMRQTEIAEPGEDRVVVRVEAAPINPSDLGMVLAGGGSPPQPQVMPRGRRLDDLARPQSASESSTSFGSDHRSRLTK